MHTENVSLHSELSAVSEKLSTVQKCYRQAEQENMHLADELREMQRERDKLYERAMRLQVCMCQKAIDLNLVSKYISLCEHKHLGEWLELTLKQDKHAHTHRLHKYTKLNHLQCTLAYIYYCLFSMYVHGLCYFCYSYQWTMDKKRRKTIV